MYMDVGCKLAEEAVLVLAEFPHSKVSSSPPLTTGRLRGANQELPIRKRATVSSFKYARRSGVFEPWGERIIPAETWGSLLTHLLMYAHHPSRRPTDALYDRPWGPS